MINKTNLIPNNTEYFGQELILNLYNCKLEKISQKEEILKYIDQLCKLIDMEKHGTPFIEKFAEHSQIAAGFSVAQMITTSLISGHFSDYLHSAYINIFSCKDFNVKKTIEFSKNFFEAKKITIQVLQR
ncbi:S-adenosylmethionine decarboxylase [Candidatus Dependentiae bacterium]|nr:S-adenosylmethionine decarboxylase [Candidatus Dependentiae bacterium]